MSSYLTHIKATALNFFRLPGLRLKLVITCLLGALYFVLFLPGSGFTDDAQFGGDTWEYQSMAVNFANGEGMQRFGGMRPFEEYKFDHYDSTLMVDFAGSAGTFHSYRTPLYPIFLGSLYAIFDVSPLLAKRVQLLLLAIIAASLPWIGYHYWEKTGFISGAIAGFVYIATYHDRAGYILTEPFFAFTVFLVAIAFIRYEIKQDVFSAALLGIVTALSLLTKGSLIYVPLLFTLYLMLSYYRTKDRRQFRHIGVFLLAFSLTLAPWSIYASMKSEALVVISTQGENILLDSHNEYSMDGNWHPEWRKTPNAAQFYNLDGMQGRFPAFRVINFYSHHPEILPESLKNKLIVGFSAFFFLKLTIVLLLVVKGMDFLRKFFQPRNGPPVVSAIAVMVVLVLVSSQYNVFPAVIDSALVTLILLLLSFLLVFWKEHLIRIPVSFYVLFLNFFILTLITYGATRFIEVVDFTFILCGIHASVVFLNMQTTQPFFPPRSP